MEKTHLKKLNNAERVKPKQSGWFFQSTNTLNFGTGTSRNKQSVIYKCPEGHIVNLISHAVNSLGEVATPVTCECEMSKELVLTDWENTHSKKAGDQYINSI